MSSAIVFVGCICVTYNVTCVTATGVVMQRIDIVVGNEIQSVGLPSPESEWMPGLRWGDASLLLTPAWIAKHAHMRWRQGKYLGLFGRRYNSLTEELVFCLLSGFGVKAEVAAAAFRALGQAGLFERELTVAEIEDVLRRPARLEDGRSVRYRFPRVRARYLEGALKVAPSLEHLDDGLLLRDHLLAINGIGPKTAAFIARNHLGCDRVAILDIHLLRAGQIARIFPSQINLAKEYSTLEQRFLQFADEAAVPASILDMSIWEMMRLIPAKRLAAANSANKALASIEGLKVLQYDPDIYSQDRLGGGARNGREQQQELFLGE